MSTRGAKQPVRNSSAKKSVAAPKTKAVKVRKKVAQKSTKKITAKKAKVQRTVKKIAPTKSTTTKKLTNKKNKTSELSFKKGPTKESQLMVLSPFRFPLDIDKLAVSTARYAGLFFVVLGALSTLWYSSLVFQPETTTLSAETISSTNPLIDLLKTASTEGQSLPFEISGSGELSNTVTVTVALPDNPYQAYFTGINILTNQSIGEYQMSKESSTGKFKYVFDTTKVPDGGYLFRVIAKYVDPTTGTELVKIYTNNSTRVITNDSLSDEEVTVSEPITLNSLLGDDTISTQTTDQNDSTIINSVTTLAETTNVVTSSLSGYIVKPENSIINQTARLNIKATGEVERVKLFLTPVSGGSQISVGYATYNILLSGWTIAFDTTKYTDGEYEATALIINSTTKYTTTPVKVTIKNTFDPSLLETLIKTNDTISTANSEVVSDETDNQSVVDNFLKLATDPEVTVSVLGKEPLQSTVQVNFNVVNAQYLELYAKAKNTGIQKYVGLPRKVDDSLWTYAWNTKNIPNGDYTLFTKVRTPYGIFMKEGIAVKVYNEIITVTTEETLKTYEDYIKIATSDPTTVTFTDFEKSVIAATPEEKLNAIVAETSNQYSLDIVDKYAIVIEMFRAELDAAFRIYATALRSGDVRATEEARATIDAVLSKIRTSQLSSEQQKELVQYIETKISQAITRVESDIEKTNRLITERTATVAQTDTDSDGVTDYDEITLYRTDPVVADSDGDGFTDGAEVLSGFDPTDSTPQVAVQYESPKEQGIVRDDLFEVHTITPIDTSIELVESSASAAIITGKALPNAFVTLYIFSTPIVVTVKTAEDGSWIYRFDKELEDGEHQIYVGVTDNAGKIIAKSKPFMFVKEAQAFTPVEAAVPGVLVTDDSGYLSTSNIIYLVTSIGVVAIGLVLILLGLHLDSRSRRSEYLFISESTT